MSESIVYGVIEDVLLANASPEEMRNHRDVNRGAMLGLPGLDEWPQFLNREMFAPPGGVVELGATSTDVVHFGAAYRAVEYEWESWLSEFEALLRRMYWVTAKVHLQTPHSGVHTFVWECEDGFHEPQKGSFQVRCEWSRDSMFA